MLKRYSDFINESLELILESDVVFSDKFRKALAKIDHPIAKALLDTENKDVTTQTNYFDIDLSKNDVVSFTPDRKAQEILGDTKETVRFIGSGGGWLKHSESNQELFDKLGYVPEGDVYRPNSTEIGEVIKKITSETSGKTYAWVKFTDGQGVYNVEKLRNIDDRINQVWSKNRQEVKVGRASRALLKAAGVEGILDKDYETFVNLYKATIDKLNDKFSFFEEVTGEKIYFWYNYQNYYQRSGTLGNSCMANARASWLEIYTENPNQVSLVIFKSQDDPDKIVGRALLWTLTDGKKFMDRIYAINDSDVQLFRDYAKENGWYSKYYNNSSDDDKAYAPDGSNVSLDLTVNLDKKDYSNYPYLDTLKYFQEGRGILSSEQRGDYVTLEDTGGGSSSSCETCGGNGEIECGDCYGNGEIECDECSGSGEISCNDCSGSGDIECSNCDGSGEIEDEGEDGETTTKECPECSGKGNNDCEDCNGNGEIECSDCRGRGNTECGNCDGRGNVSCYDCN
jgi:hypothetical protein